MSTLSLTSGSAIHELLPSVATDSRPRCETGYPADAASAQPRSASFLRRLLLALVRSLAVPHA
jgi:hypothetical protein